MGPLAKDGSRTWNLLTAAFPPQQSSMASWSWRLSEGLAAEGQIVRVWAVGEEDFRMSELEPGIALFPFARQWNHRALVRLATRLDRQPKPRTIIVPLDDRSWTPEARAHVVPWLRSRRLLKDEIWAIVLERPVSVQLSSWGDFRQSRAMRRWYRDVIRESHRVVVLSDHWKSAIRGLGRGQEFQVAYGIAAPSTVSRFDDPVRARNLRKAFARRQGPLFGTFSSFREIGQLEFLNKVIPTILRSVPDSSWLGIGRQSETWVAGLRELEPSIADRVECAGELDPLALSSHIQACDLMLQPYPYGVSTNRSSVMACMHHAKPILTTTGPSTEQTWLGNSGLTFTPHQSPREFIKSAITLSSDPVTCQRLGDSAGEFYARQYSQRSMIQKLIDIRDK